MKIVVDTNVFISGVFFGGTPRQVLQAVTTDKVEAFATSEIVDEYNEIVDELLGEYCSRLDKKGLTRFIMKLKIIDSVTQTDICRDPDDNKFLSCAVDSKSLYIVSGDKDLLILKKYEDVGIITAKEFCDRYLLNTK